MARRPLIVAYVPKDGLFLDPVPRRGRFEGIEYELFAIIMKAAGIRRYRLYADDKFQKRFNDSSLHTLLLVQRGIADIAVSSQVIHERSALSADFTIPYFYQDINFATNLPQAQPRVYAFAYPFDATTWAMIAAISLVVPLAFAAMFRVGDFWKNWLHMVANLVGKSAPGERISGPAQAVFTAAWWFGTTILLLSYSSMIFSCLTIPIMEVPPKNFKQLAEAVQKGRYEVRCLNLFMFRHSMETAPFPEVRYLHEAMWENGWYHEGENAYRMDFKPNTAYIGTSLPFKVMFGMPPFATKFQSEGFRPLIYGMAVNKRLKRLKNRLDVIISRAQQAGLVDKITSDHYFKLWLKSSIHDESEDPIKPISLGDVVGAFYVLAIGLCISTLLFIIECITFKLTKRVKAHTANAQNTIVQFR